MSRKRKAAAIDLIATDESAWQLSRQLLMQLTTAVRDTMMQRWRETGTLPHIGEMRVPGMPLRDMSYCKERLGWFDMCIESIYLPRVIDAMHVKDHHHKRVLDVDFATLYSDEAQEAQCKEDLLMMAKVTPGEFWPVSPRSAFRLMAAAEYLLGAINNNDFAEQYGHGFQGDDVRARWKAEGPVGMSGGLDPLRDRSWYFGLRDCFAKIAQRIAAGNKPHPKTHAELWACCLLFDADDFLMDTLGDDEQQCARFDALPERPCDKDFEITRYALLGPIFGLPKPPPPKKRTRVARASSSTRPTAATRSQRAQAMFEGMVNDESPYAIGALKRGDSGMREQIRAMCEAMAAGEEVSEEEEDGFGMSFGEPRCIYNLPLKPTAQWFDPLPPGYFKITPRSGGDGSGASGGDGGSSGVQPPAWDSQLSTAGWRGWPIVEAHNYGLVYVVPAKRFAYYDDHETDDECIVYFGTPLLSPSGVYMLQDLRKPPFEGAHMAM